MTVETATRPAVAEPSNGLFEVLPEVPPEIRHPNSRQSALTVALEAGQVVFIPNKRQDQVSGSLASVVRGHGFKVSTRAYVKDGVPGVVVWAEKRPEVPA